MKTLILDNYDSFTYILAQYVAELGGVPEVYKNDEILLNEIESKKFTHIIISPGPGNPGVMQDIGICLEVIQKFAGHIPILGVCLGHQAIVHALGGSIIRATRPMHGKRSWMKLSTGSPLFRGVPEKIRGMRYHSLIAKRDSLPEELKITAETSDDSLIMAIQHTKQPLFGIQFHPESIGTEFGKQMIANFLKT